MSHDKIKTVQMIYGRLDYLTHQLELTVLHHKWRGKKGLEYKINTVESFVS